MSMTPFLFMVLLAAVERAVTDVRIWDGEPALITEFPSTAALFSYKENGRIGRCGATIISDTWVLTAAHCVKKRRVSDVKVIVGTSNKKKGAVHQASSIIMHKGYRPKRENDIAVIEVEVPFDLNGNTIVAARLPFQDEVFPAGIKVTAVGWGLTRDYEKTNFLQKLDMVKTNRRECEEYYSSFSVDSHLCAIDRRNGNRLCKGDSGGPLYFEDMVIGFLSYGKNCASRKVPEVFTNIAYFRDWIRHRTGI